MIFLHIIKAIAVRCMFTLILCFWFMGLVLIILINPTADLTKMQMVLVKLSHDTHDLYKHGGE